MTPVWRWIWIRRKITNGHKLPRKPHKKPGAGMRECGAEQSCRSGVSAERRKLCGNSNGGSLPKAATPKAADEWRDSVLECAGPPALSLASHVPKAAGDCRSPRPSGFSSDAGASPPIPQSAIQIPHWKRRKGTHFLKSFWDGRIGQYGLPKTNFAG